jgi:hypothetical protein
MIGLSGAE